MPHGVLADCVSNLETGSLTITLIVPPEKLFLNLSPRFFTFKGAFVYRVDKILDLVG